MLHWSEHIYPSIQKLDFADISKAQAPVLTIHAPWIEAPDLVFNSIRTFLGGSWPEAAETIAPLEP